MPRVRLRRAQHRSTSRAEPTYTTPGKRVTKTTKRPLPGGGYRTKTKSEQGPSVRTGGTRTYTQENVPEVSVPVPSAPGGKAGIVLLASTSLYLMATWNEIGLALYQSLTTPSKGFPSVNWPTMAGGLFFILALFVIANTSDDAANLILLMLLAMWLLFIMFGGFQTMQKLLAWMAPKSPGTIRTPTSTTSQTQGTVQQPAQPKTVTL